MKLTPLKKFIFSLILFALVYVIGEALVGTYYVIRNKSFASPSSLLKNTFGSNWQPLLPIECDYLSVLGPHPYLGYVMFGNAAEECKLSYQGLLNNELMSGPDYPEKKNPDEFVIMLTGGSVADQLGSTYLDNKHYFTEYLNQRFHPPRGKTFRIIVSALGDYRFPQNLLGPILHHNIIDGIIDLSGYNESHQYHHREKLDKPSSNYWVQFDLENKRFKNNSILNNRVLVKKANESWCRYSYLCFFALEKYFQFQVMEKDENTRYENQKKIFQYPKEWTYEEAWQDRMKKHQGYYKITHSMCTKFDLYCAYFLQPIPAIDKVLTEIEKLQIQNENKELKPVYSRMVRELTSLKKEGIPIYSLTHVFKNHKETIYGDHIHYLLRENNPVKKGNEIVLGAMIEVLERDWKLQRKK